MFPQLESVTSPELPVKDKLSYFSSINVFHGANIDEKQQQILKEKIGELLESPYTRNEGLLLFEATLEQCSTFYLDNWHGMVKACLKSTDPVCLDISYRILKSLLKTSKFSSYISTLQHYLPAIVSQLLRSNNSTHLEALECVHICLKLHPKILAPLKDTIEGMIINQMDPCSTKMSEILSDCFIGVLRCYTYKSSDHTVVDSQNTYINFYKKTLYTLQEILNKLLGTDEVVPIDKDNIDNIPSTFELPDYSNPQLSETMKLGRIFSFLSTCAAKILCSENPDMLFEVPVLWILEFLNRIFLMTEKVKNAASSDHSDFILLVYPLIQQGAFTILESLIQKFGLVEQVENIVHLLRKSIEASYVCSFTSKSNSQIRNITWRLFNVWIAKNGAKVSFEAGNQKFLIEELLKDIVPEDVIEDVPLATVQQKRSSSKAMKFEVSFPQPGETSKHNMIRKSMCNEALNVLKILIQTASPFLDEKLKEEISYSALNITKKVQKYIHPAKKFPFPYMDDSCRKNLYELCLAFIISSNFHNRVLRQSIAVLKIAQKEQNLEIKKFSYFSNSLCRLVLHPRKKCPEVVTNKKKSFEPVIEESVCYGWPNTSNWNMSNSEHENHSANNSNSNISPMKTDRLSSENHNVNKDGKRNNFASANYNSYDMNESQNSSQSESESDSSMENESAEEENNEESPTKPLILAAHPMQNVIEEETAEGEVSSEEDSFSLAEEEDYEDVKIEDEDVKIEDEEVKEEDEEVKEEDEDVKVEDEDVKIDEEEYYEEVKVEEYCEDVKVEEEVIPNKINHTDQNGLSNTSEDEQAFAKGENGDFYIDEEDLCEEDEVEGKELHTDRKHEAESFEESDRPLKKQKIMEESVEVKEVSEEIICGETNNVSDETQNSNGVVEQESSRSASPTLEQMTQNLVLEFSPQLAES